MAAFSARLADGLDPRPWKGNVLNYLTGDAYCRAPLRPPFHLRYPARAAAVEYDGERRNSALDVTGPAGAAYAIRILDRHGTIVETVNGTIPESHHTLIPFTLPARTGRYILEFAGAGHTVGRGSMEVVARLPATAAGLGAYNRRPQPTIFEPLSRLPGC